MGLTQMGSGSPYQDLGQTRLITGSMSCSVIAATGPRNPVVHKTRAFTPPTCISYPNRRFYSWLFIQKSHLSGTGEGRERRENCRLYRKASTRSSCREKYKPSTQLLSKADREERTMPL